VWVIGGIVGLLEACILQNPLKAIHISNDRTVYLLAFLAYAAVAWLLHTVFRRLTGIRLRTSGRIRSAALFAALVLCLAGGVYAIVPPYWFQITRRGPPASRRPNVILITLDTTRADHLGCYGHNVPTSPFLDSLARNGFRFENAYTNSTWTLPAHASLFTGLMPRVHGAGYGNFVLSDKVRTLAEILTEKGYATAAFTGGPFLASGFNLDQGFAYYNEHVDSHSKLQQLVLFRLLAKPLGGRSLWGSDGQRKAEEINAEVFPYLYWLRDRRPFFLFINYFDPHEPYDPPQKVRQLLNIRTHITGHIRNYPLNKQNGLACHKDGTPLTPEEFQGLKTLYDGEIRYLDDRLSELWQQFRKCRLLDNTMVIILSDHGETIGEHGFLDHGHNLYQEQVRIPLIIQLPNRKPATVKENAQIIDLFPTVLEYAGIGDPGKIQGHSLMPLLNGTAAASGPVHAELDIDPHPRFKAFRRAQEMILHDTDKYIASSDRDNMLFDLQSDPSESTNILSTRPEQATALREALELYFRGLAKIEGGPGRTIDNETREKLKALGYVE
jgi:arylsulfatase A-like enzyme